MHASYLAYQSVEYVAREKQILEEASNVEIIGNRHHYWHLNPSNPEDTLLIHEKAGIRYDSSLVHDRYLGWRRGSSWPFYPFHHGERRELKTLQIQVNWMDNQLFGYKRFNQAGGISALRDMADVVLCQGGCFVIDIHDYVCDHELFPGWSNAFKDIVDSAF